VPTSELSGLLAGIATVAQLAALAVVVRIACRHGPLPLFAGVIGVLSLMACRRALSALGYTALTTPPTYLAVYEGIGLAISLLLLTTALIAQGRMQCQPPAADATDLKTTGPAVAPEIWDDRELLCYDLHDGLAQLVFGARMHFDTYCSVREADGAGADRELALTRQRLNEAAAEVTRVVSWLKLSFSPDTSLSEAIAQYLTELAQSEEWRHELEDHLDGRRLEPATEAMSYRVVQEALNNAARHARTQRVKVSLGSEDSALVVTVQDWGRGFDLREALCEGHGLGLRGMHRRAQRIGGLCTVDSRAGEGTTVVLRVPGALAEAQVS
jgi:signal transduction histidine kinase